MESKTKIYIGVGIVVGTTAVGIITYKLVEAYREVKAEMIEEENANRIVDEERARKIAEGVVVASDTMVDDSKIKLNDGDRLAEDADDDMVFTKTKFDGASSLAEAKRLRLQTLLEKETSIDEESEAICDGYEESDDVVEDNVEGNYEAAQMAHIELSGAFYEPVSGTDVGVNNFSETAGELEYSDEDYEAAYEQEMSHYHDEDEIPEEYIEYEDLDETRYDDDDELLEEGIDLSKTFLPLIKNHPDSPAGWREYKDIVMKYIDEMDHRIAIDSLFEYEWEKPESEKDVTVWNTLFMDIRRHMGADSIYAQTVTVGHLVVYYAEVVSARISGRRLESDDRIDMIVRILLRNIGLVPAVKNLAELDSKVSLLTNHLIGGAPEIAKMFGMFGVSMEGTGDVLMLGDCGFETQLDCYFMQEGL